MLSIRGTRRGARYEAVIAKERCLLITSDLELPMRTVLREVLLRRLLNYLLWLINLSTFICIYILLILYYYYISTLLHYIAELNIDLYNYMIISCILYMYLLKETFLS